MVEIVYASADLGLAVSHPRKTAPAVNAVSTPPLKNLLRVMMFSWQRRRCPEFRNSDGLESP
jgi:hypothetical protein